MTRFVPAKMMTRLFFLSVKCLLVILHISSHNTLHNAQMCYVHKKNQRTEDKLNHYFEESLLPTQSLSLCLQERGDPYMKLVSLSSRSRDKPSRDSENERIKILLERQEEQILAEVRTEIQKHEVQADYDRRSIQVLNGTIASQRRN